MTSPLHMVEMHPDEAALFRFLQGHAGAHPRDEDLGYGLHAWLTAAFAEMAPSPFRVMRPRRGPFRLLAYSLHDATALRDHLHEMAEPAAAAVCADDAIITKRMPYTWAAGRTLGFEVLCCPVVRRSTEGRIVEKDVLLARADTDELGQLKRDEIYRVWLAQRLDGAASLSRARLEGFQLVHTIRRSRSPGNHGLRMLTRPQALLTGVLRVEDPEAFAALLGRGVGRHRAFGYGMLLLRPPT